MGRFLQSFLYISFIIVLLLFFSCFIFLLYNNYPLYFNIAFMLLLLIGIIWDDRFSISRKLIFIFLCIIQFLLYMYLEIIPLLLIKDLFWFSVCLNICFIWHVLILNWLMTLLGGYNDISKIIYYIISRISLVSSLTFVQLILCEVWLFFGLIGSYDFGCKNYWKIDLKWHNKILSYDSIFLSLIKSFIFILIKTTNYFINIFNNYSLLLLGKNDKLNWKSYKFLFHILIFLLLFMISILTNIPRLYFVWGIYIFLDLIIKIKSSFMYLYDLYKCDKLNEWYNNRYFYVIFSALCSNLYGDISSYQVKFNLIYNKELYLDYYCYIIDLNWSESWRFNIYDICDIFIYREDIREWIYAKYFITNILPDDMKFYYKNDVLDFINEYDLDLDIDLFYKKIYPNYYEGLNDSSKLEMLIERYSTWSQENFKMTLKEFIFKYYDDRILY